MTKAFDVRKYGYNFRISEEAFRRKKERFTYERIARQYDTIYPFRTLCAKMHYEKEYVSAKELAEYGEKYMAGVLLEHEILNTDTLYKRVYGECYLFGVNKRNLFDKVAYGVISSELAAVLVDYWNLTPPQNGIRGVEMLPKYSAFFAYDKTKMANVLAPLPDNMK